MKTASTVKAPTVTSASLSGLAKPWRIGLSLWVVLHIAAVFAEPFRFFTQSPVKPAAEEAGWLRRSLAPYVEFLYLSHGYSFFAPNPGPSHLLECSIQPQNSVELPTRRVFPDREIDKPRLLYHRYFMLAEFYNTLFAPVALSPNDQQDRALRERWSQDRSLYEALQESIQRSMQSAYPTHTLKLRRIEHELPAPEQILDEKWRLTDPRLYVPLPEGDIEP